MYYFDWTGLNWYKPQFGSLSSVIYSHPGSHWGFLLSEITWVCCFPVELQVVLVWADGWGLVVTNHTAHLSCHQCSEAVFLCFGDRQLKRRPHLFLLLNEARKSGAVVCTFRWITILCGRTDCNATPRAPALCHLPRRWKNFRWFCK